MQVFECFRRHAVTVSRAPFHGAVFAMWFLSVRLLAGQATGNISGVCARREWGSHTERIRKRRDERAAANACFEKRRSRILQLCRAAARPLSNFVSGQWIRGASEIRSRTYRRSGSSGGRIAGGRSDSNQGRSRRDNAPGKHGFLDLSGLIDDRRVNDLPLNGRNVIGLAGILPGVTNVSAPQSMGDALRRPHDGRERRAAKHEPVYFGWRLFQ